MKILYAVALAAMASLGSWHDYARAADIEICPDWANQMPNGAPLCESAVCISGTIERGDYDEFHELMKTQGAEIHSIALAESPGGDLVEAIKIGSLIRELKLNTVVGNRFDLLGQSSVSLLTISGAETEERRWICASACVFIWLAGVNRAGNWRLVVHRPYYDPEYFGDLSVGESDLKYRELEEFAYGYLRKMDTPEGLIAKMREVSSSDGYVLPMEFAEERLNGNIASFDEWITARCGTMSEEDLSHARAISPKKIKTPQEQVLHDAARRYGECYVAARIAARKEGRAAAFGQ